MPYPAVSPYDVLDVPPDVDVTQLMVAYRRAVQARKFPPNMIAQAFADLRNARKRAEHDLLVVVTKDISRMSEQILADLPELSLPPMSVTPIPLVLPPLTVDDAENDFRELPKTPQEIRSWPDTPKFGSVLPPLQLPT